MKKIKVFIMFFFMCISYASAQTVYYDASNFALYGKGVEKTQMRYQRFPDSLKTQVRKTLWDLSCNSAGMAIRFHTNSTKIVLKWESLFDNHMNHMTDTGIKGLDLYCLLDNGIWKFVNSGRPTGKITQQTIVSSMIPKDREYMLYLSLYDGVKSLSIGVDSLSIIGVSKIINPIREKPIVYYGTSITQGACASRPGMAYTNIISRRLNRECINWGFSGNGVLDLEVAKLMTEINAGVFILDFSENTSVKQMNERLIPFYKIIRIKHPKTPIIFVEHSPYTHATFDQSLAHIISNKNKTLNDIFHKLKQQKEKHIYLIHSDKMSGKDGEATVDGAHFTDLGMVRYADIFCPIIKKLLKE